MFFPGPFYLGVYGIYDSEFVVCATFVRQRVKVRHATTLEGDGFSEIKSELDRAETRRRHCRGGAGFIEQLDCPRPAAGYSLPTTPRQPDDRPASQPARQPASARAARPVS